PPNVQLARAPRLLTYYPPDVNCAEFAKQDLRFDSLKLLDTRITEKLAREATTKSKGKSERVRVESGLRVRGKSEAGKGGRKKKRR
ncbi:MAG: hypothetical protein SGCHY_004533, partial [Lobulomycetales sp.]